MSSADPEIRIDLRGNPSPFLVVVAAALLGYGFWLWRAEPGLAAVLATLPMLFLLKFLERPLTLQRVVLLRPDKIVVASRLLLRSKRELSPKALKQINEKQIGTKAKSIWALELSFDDGAVQNLGELSPGFRPSLRRAQTLIRRARAQQAD